MEGIRTTDEHAASLGVHLTLECWNRYGTYILNRLDEGARMWRETQLTNGGIIADTFHMNIEERAIPDAILASADILNHVHLSDYNRLAPGPGHIDFAVVLQALGDAGYGEGLAFELIPTLPNVLGDEPDRPTFDDVARQAIAHMREAERLLAAGLGAIAAQMAWVAGASYVAVIDPIEKRRRAAVDAGADAAFDLQSTDVGLELKKATGRAGVDAAMKPAATSRR